METIIKKIAEERESSQYPEHILACLSPSEQNERVLRNAARLANALGARFSAIFVETSRYSAYDDQTLQQLQDNKALARSLGADIVVFKGDNVAYQIAEYVRLSSVTQIIYGQNSFSYAGKFQGKRIPFQLEKQLPDIDLHLIPQLTHKPHNMSDLRAGWNARLFATDLLRIAIIMLLASLIGWMFDSIHFDERNIISVYMLAVMLASIWTRSLLSSFMASIISVVLFDLLFAAPRGSMYVYNKSFFITFIVMFLTSAIMGTLTRSMKTSSDESAQSSYRARMLFDVGRKLRNCATAHDIIDVTCTQIARMTGCGLLFYPLRSDGAFLEPLRYSVNGNRPVSELEEEKKMTILNWVYEHREAAGAGTDYFPRANHLYLPCFTRERSFGIICLDTLGKKLDPVETSIVKAIAVEGTLTYENLQLQTAIKDQEIRSETEQLRSRLLRAISHDLRTPLTSISGNISNLMQSSESFSLEMRKQMYTDIYDNSVWLIYLVENLMTTTRLESGSIKLNTAPEMVEDVIRDGVQQALQNRKSHPVSIRMEDDLLMALMDARMISQVMSNLVINALNYTPEGTPIDIYAYAQADDVVIEVRDTGPGIAAADHDQIFDLFFTGSQEIVDDRRSMGLGLFLCKKVMEAHGGSIALKDNEPHGCIFTLHLPLQKVPDFPS